MLKIGKIREENCITQEQLAQESGLDVDWIQKLESGEIGIKDLTIVNSVRLLKGLNNLCSGASGSKIEEDCADLVTAYVTMRELLK